MNNVLYNQVSEKLFEQYSSLKFQDQLNDKDEEGLTPLADAFVKDLEIDQRIVDLFNALYAESSKMEGGIYVHNILKSIKSFFPVQKELVIDLSLPINERGRLFAIQAHRDVDQTYDDAPYPYHLWSAVQFGKKYKHHIPTADQLIVEAGIWNHDVVEDGHRTYNDLKKYTNETVARIACAVTTNLYGHNRKARADENYYNRIKNEEYATFVKLCDRLANVSWLNNGRWLSQRDAWIYCSTFT